MNPVNEKKEINETAEKVAEEMFDSSDYKSNETVSRGLAETHEQVSDKFMDGD